MKALRITTALVLALGVSACGSTVSLGQQSASGSAPALGSGGNSGAGASAQELGPSIPAQVSGARGSASSTASAIPTSNSADASAGASSVSSAPAGAVSGRGFTAKQAYIGVTTQKDVGTATSALGISNLDFGDQEGQIRAVIAEINRRGGILGRTVVPHFYDLKSADLESNRQGAAQATCAAFTQDFKVLAVVNLVAGVDVPSLYTCLSKHDTPIVSGGFIPVDSQFQRSLQSYLYQLVSPAYDQFGSVFLDRLNARQYFSGWSQSGGPASGAAKVGIEYADDPTDTRIAGYLKSELTHRGFAVVKTYAYDGSSVQTSTSSIGRSVLPMRGAGVTHLVFLDSAVLYFMIAAENQGYRPRYALTSYSATATLLQSNASAKQLNGSLGFGWLPVSDVDAQHDPGATAGKAACRSAMSKGSQNISSRGAELVAYEFCDGFFMISEAMKLAGGFSTSSLRAGVSHLGSTFRSAIAFRTALRVDRPYIPGAGRDFGWDTPCSCFRYLNTSTFAF